MIWTGVKVTTELLELFRNHRVMTAPTGERWKEGDTIMLDPESRLEQYSHILTGDIVPFEIGGFSYSHSNLSPDIRVGRFCSLSWGVQIIAVDHPMEWTTTSPITHQPQDIPGLAAYLMDMDEQTYQLHRLGHPRNPAVLGHDVWIGMQVLIKRGVKIGHGAVVGAGSVVTKDVPPYAIVGGAPARIIRYRFPELLIERLLQSQWWNYGPEKLQSLDMRAPERFLDALDAAIVDGLLPMALSMLTGKEIMAAGKPAT